MARSFTLVVATACLLGALYAAIAGGRPHTLYSETGRAHSGPPPAAPARPR